MKRSQFAESEILMPWQGEEGTSIDGICRKAGIS
jgi:hypothetical protein